MYLLSIEGDAVKTVLKGVTKLPSRWQVVYRWGMFWGYLVLESGEPQWMSERHQYVSHGRDELGNTFLLESIESSSHGAPPYMIDDIWKEEVKLDGVCTYGNLLTIRGNKSTIEDILKKFSISYTIPESTSDTVETSSSSETQHRPSQHRVSHPLPREQPHPHTRGTNAGSLRAHTNRPAYVRPPGLPPSYPPGKPSANVRRPQNAEQGARGRYWKGENPINRSEHS